LDQADAHPYSNTNSHSYTNSESDSYADTNSDAYADTDSNTDRDSDGNLDLIDEPDGLAKRRRRRYRTVHDISRDRADRVG
jgi:hypothetical protein